MKNSDFYQLNQLLSVEEQELLLQIRNFVEQKVKPIINDCWSREEFPHQIIPEYAKLAIAGTPYTGFDCPGRSFLVEGFISMELARGDCSIATFHGVHSGLAMGTIYLCGSDVQKQKWLPTMAKAEKIGAFGLTEPMSGSDAAGGLTTTATRKGSNWVLNGQKKWIGNATFADIIIIWARDTSDGNVKGFIVEKDTPGFFAKKMEHKTGLRVVQNAEITLNDCKVTEENRLQNASSFKDTANVLRMTRADVAWEAVGCMQGAYDFTVEYCKQREQFGKPIGSFQIVQDRLATMLANITSAQCLCVQLSRLQDTGDVRDEQASLAKMFCTVKMRETVGLARELFGGNGILLDHHVGRYVSDAEAIYSYEGTREINSLIVGRAVTGISAFV